VGVTKRDEDGTIVCDEEGNEVSEVLLEVEEIHKVILERNCKHFHQADATPFAGGAKNMILYDLIGYTGMSQATRDVVDSTFMEKYGNEFDILPEMEQVIRELAMPEAIKVFGKKIDCEITEADFMSGFKKRKASTSTSPRLLLMILISRNKIQRRHISRTRNELR
jgi:hypothetical protein